MNLEETKEITMREKLVVILVVFLIRMLKPWTYDHQFTQFWDEVKATFTKQEK